MTESRLVIGAGATGRTHLLQAWVDELGDPPSDGPIVWLAGSPRHSVDEAEVKAATQPEPGVIVADDLQWFEAGALARLTEAASDAFIFASRRPPTEPGPVADAVELLEALLTRSRPAHRLGLWELDQFAPVLTRLRATTGGGGSQDAGRVLATGAVERIHGLTAGSVGFAADLVASGWDGDLDSLPVELVDAVTTRIGRARPEAQELAAIWSVLTTETPSGGVDLAVRALPIEIDPDLAQRALRSGGLVDGSGNLIPLVKAAILTDLTARRRAALHDRLAGALADDDPIAAARHLLAGQGELPAAPQILARAALRLASSQPQEAETFIARAQQLGLPPPEAALLHALSAFHLGSPDALIHLEQARSGEGGSVDDRASLLGFGIDLRDLRFEAASQRPIGGELAQPLLSIAKGLGGQVAAPEPQPNRTPIGQMVAAMATGLAALAEGNAGEALGELSTAADDFDRLRPTAPFGITPHSLGSLAALTVGDLTAVEIFTEQALNHASGGPGEDLTHKLIRAYGQLVDGQYGDALAILRDRAALGADGGGEPDRAGTGFDSPEAVGSGPRSSGLLAQRDRLLLAALEASIARRSGDTGRLRAAWKRAEDALIRPSVSWLLNDFFVELLAAGARLGDTRRVEPVLEELVAQGLSLPGSGPGPVGAHWLRLQCALASEDSETVIDAAEQLAGLDPSDDRSRARVAAAGIWVQVMAAEATEEAVVEVAERLSAVGDGWEASRLLGQAALDEEDPRAARRMLELARTSATEHVDESSGEGLSALGLSEREAEVALLVAEGRTHKEIGAQLFISPKTVEHHVAKIRQKLGAGSRAELLAIIRDAAETH